MRFLILSDIHANWEALEAVLAQAGGKYDQAICCGDLAGYGAEPDRIVEWVRGNVRLVVRGNHDKAVAGLEDLEWFNPVARASALWSREQMESENLAYLRELPKGPAEENGLAIAHGSPLDEDEYVVSVRQAAQLWSYLPATVTFFGHTHIQGGFEFIRKHVRLLRGAKGRPIHLDANGWYLINPGAVGQPRDGDPRAAYALFDSGERAITLCRAPYDIAGAQRKIVAAGLPEVLALRLESGQ